MYVACDYARIPQQTQNICIASVQRRPNYFDVGPTLYNCCTNVLCLLGLRAFIYCHFASKMPVTSV